MKINLKILRLILILLAAVLAFGGIFVVLRAWERREDEKAMAAWEKSDGTGKTLNEGTDLNGDSNGNSNENNYGESAEEDSGFQVYQNGRWYGLNRNLETVLLIGLDKFEEALSSENTGATNNQQSDFLLLLLLDHEKKTCEAVHLNRDTMAEIRRLSVDGTDAGTVTKQLALAHTYGRDELDSCSNTVQAVSGLLYGIPVDHFVCVTMDAVPAVTDLVGGIPLEITEDLTKVDPAMKQGTVVCLNGEQALKFVRARGELEDSTNLSRMERQRQFIEAFRKAFAEKQKNEETFLTDAFVTTANYMATDCSVEELERIGTCAMEYENKGIRTMEGEAVKGAQFMEFYPEEEKLKELVLELFFVETRPSE